MKYSRQRESILNCLKNRKDHPSADAVYSELRETDDKMSLGTVYRNLGLLADLGVINKISCVDGVERYDYITEPHYHFICKCCGSIIDVDSKQVDGLNDIINNKDVSSVEYHTLTFYGICKKCSENKK